MHAKTKIFKSYLFTTLSKSYQLLKDFLKLIINDNIKYDDNFKPQDPN